MYVVMRDKIKTHSRFLFQSKAGTPSLETKSKAIGGSLYWCLRLSASAEAVPRSRSEERLTAGRVGIGPRRPPEISPRRDFLLLPFFLPSFGTVSFLLLMPL